MKFPRRIRRAAHVSEGIDTILKRLRERFVYPAGQSIAPQKPLPPPDKPLG